jgi:predicted aldo/keto reductase-like oxidoreductase
MERRDFIKTAAMSSSMLNLFPAILDGTERTKEKGQLERRSLGRTGENLSILGFGGIVVMDATTDEAASRVKKAIEQGVNYFDVAPSYGNAIDMLGPALEPYRKNVFLACKTTKRTKLEANIELNESLKKMRTDHFNLYQHHAVTTRKDVETIFSPNGAMEAFLEAQKAGKVRHIGFSAHSVEAALSMMDHHPFDTILFPINFRTWHAGNFGPQVLAKAQEMKMGILALKAMANRPWPEKAVKTHPKCWYEPLSDPVQAALGLRFTLSHPITAAIPPGDENLFDLALQLALDFKPLESTQAEILKAMTATDQPIFRFPNPEA